MLPPRSLYAFLFFAGCTAPQPAPPAPASTIERAPSTPSIADAAAQGPAKPPVDSEIARMVGSVEPARLLDEVKRLAAFGTRHSLSDTASETRGIGAAARSLKGRFEANIAASQGRLEVRLQDYVAPQGARVPKPWPMQNVLAVLPGTATGDHARTLVISGHFDSRASDIMNSTIDAPGANDDASGVAVVLEACRAMAPFSFEASIVFAAVSGEEQGLLGSEAMVADFKARGVRVEAMLTNDIVGASRSANGCKDVAQVRVFSQGLPNDAAERDQLLAVGGESDGRSRQLARAVAEAQATYAPAFNAMLVFRLDRYLRGGDHKPFHAAGIPAVRMTEVEENFNRQHQDIRAEAGVEYGDVIEHVDPEYMANVARVNIASLATLARAPIAPDKVRLDVRGLDEDTTLLFVPDSDASVAYEVVARPTSAPTWTQSFSADRSGNVRIPLSKDHNIFALRAVGPRGHRSLAVFPLPLRGDEAWPPK